MDLLDQKAKRASWDFKDRLVLEEFQAQRVLRETPVHQVFLVIQENRVLVASKENQAKPAMMGSKEILVHLVIQDQEVILASKVHQEKKYDPNLYISIKDLLTKIF